MDEKHNFTFFGVSIKKNQIKCLGWQHLNVTNSTIRAEYQATHLTVQLHNISAPQRLLRPKDFIGY